jgi:hypothetical protein
MRFIELGSTVIRFWKYLFSAAFLILTACLPLENPTASVHENEPKELPIVQQWLGDYPCSQLNRLPEEQRTSRIGYLGSPAQFAGIWQSFKPEKVVPEVDFGKHLVVFCRNVTFYNRVAVTEVLLRHGIAEILIMETMSAAPVEDKVAMGMAVIPRAGVKYIEAGMERIPVKEPDHGFLSSPLNASYTIEGQEIRLQEGRSVRDIAPVSATKVRNSVFGEVVYGDLDGDGDEDAALILVHDPGGSGTFYYLVAALNLHDQYRGTNGVFLGDRIKPRKLVIRDGLVVFTFIDRLPYEPLNADPSVEKRIWASVEKGNLIAKPIEEEE